jgi:16S rRNA (guanine966-N2)-methyltransferase
MSFRVTGGTFRGRSLLAPEGLATRPSSSRLREALFSIIGQELSGWSVLDLYAGSGSLGIDACSRGASPCTFVERERSALQCLQSNLRNLSIAKAEVVAAEVGGWCPKAAAAGRQWRLVLVDPPFVESWPVTVDWWSLVLPGGLVVVQHPPELQLSAPLTLEKGRQYGASALSIFRA